MGENEQRKYNRCVIDAPARITAQTETGEVVSLAGHTRDISRNGLFVYSRRRLQPQAKVKIDLFVLTETLRRFMASPHVHVEISGEVVRSEPWGMAVKLNEKFAFHPAYDEERRSVLVEGDEDEVPA
jgi:hypothetical protein